MNEERCQCEGCVKNWALLNECWDEGFKHGVKVGRAKWFFLGSFSIVSFYVTSILINRWFS